MAKALRDQSLPSLVHTAWVHEQFKAIHQFIDGSGSVGRPLITLMLIARGVLPASLRYTNVFTGSKWQDRCGCLPAASRVGARNGWLECSLNGTAKRLDAAFTTAQRAVETPCGAEILSETSQASRDHVFYARDIFEIQAEPARLTPALEDCPGNMRGDSDSRHTSKEPVPWGAPHRPS